MKIHLVSMPMTDASVTPIQVGCLKSFVDHRFKNNNQVKTYTYSAYLSIMLRAFNLNYAEISDMFSINNELMYFMLVLRNFNLSKGQDQKKILSAVLHIYNKSNRNTSNIKKSKKKTFTKQDVFKVEKATIAFIDRDLVPQLSKKELNVVGFTLSNDQNYASLYCYLYLKKKYPNYKMLFLFGGGLVSYPRVLKLLKKFDVKGLAVTGEGELKLEKIISTCLENGSDDVDSLIKKCSSSKGVYALELLSEDDIFSIQSGDSLSTIEDLPLPDYDEYFETLRKYCADEETYLGLKEMNTMVEVILEGSRGCSWGKCDFCFEQKCDGITYRSKTPEKIYESVLTFLKKHKVIHLNFVDSVCDSWITRFCDLLLRDKINAFTTYDLRAVHSDCFYAQLALIGCDMVQIGIEALSDPLLIKMNKGAKLFHNLQVMKYLKELGINNGSNLVIDHPKSDLADIKTTREVIGFIPHFPKLNLSFFTLTEYSWLYNELTEEEKRNLQEMKNKKIPSEVKDLFTNDVRLPSYKRAAPKVIRSWSSFTKWYTAMDTKVCYLNVFRLSSDTILIKENRYNKIKEYLFSGDQEKIYTLCHAAKTIEELVKVTGIEKSNIELILSEFLKNKLVIKASNRFLSLAIRPKEELINNYHLRHSVDGEQ